MPDFQCDARSAASWAAWAPLLTYAVSKHLTLGVVAGIINLTLDQGRNRWLLDKAGQSFP